MSYGVLTTGFAAKTFQVLRDEVDQDVSDTWSPSVDVSDASDLGQLIAIFLLYVAELWELGEAVYNAFDPDAATGDALAQIAALTGTTPELAKSSTVTLTLTGDDATTVPAGSEASVVGTEEKFTTDTEVTTAAVSAWQSATGYVVGDRVKNDTPDRIYECVTAGTSAGSGGPTGTTTGIADNTAVWDYVGDGEAAVDVEATSSNTGPIVAAARTLTQIETPVGGWTDVINLDAATLGQLVETDENVRLRREEELVAQGSSTVDGLRADLLKVEGVTNVKCFWNHTDATDGDGVPPHAVEILVQGGTDADIFQAIFDSIGGGIETYGTESDTVTDSEGNDHTIKFSRPTEIRVYVDITLTYDADLYPSDGDTLVTDELVEHGNALGVGVDVNSWNLSATLNSLGIGVLNVTPLYFDTSPSPSTSTPISIGTRQIATFQSGDIAVTSSAATP